MSKIKILGSSSKGNCYIIQTSKEYLVIECAYPYRDILSACDYDLVKISGCIVSHEHSDHARYITDIARGYIDVYCPPEMIESNDLGCLDVTPLADMYWKSIGGFKVMPFKNYHDVECYGYIIKHKEFSPILFATDTYSINYKFNGIKNYLIEANYSDELIEGLDKIQKDRITLSHLSIDNCINYLEQNGAENAEKIILIHLSSRHSNAEEFKDRVEKKFGVPTYIADKNVEITI